MKKTICLLGLLLYLTTSFVMGEKPDKSLFLKKEHVSEKGEKLLYRVLYPENYDKQKAYPLILFLHGAGERGNDNELQLTYIADLLFKDENRKKFPAIVLLPQCPPEGYWPFPDHPDKEGRWDRINYPEKATASVPMKLVEELVDSYLRNENIDRNRIYVTGLSMGGMGTFDIVARNPKLFAAAVPICGGVNVKRLKKCAKHVKFRIFHGDADDIVPVITSREAFAELKRLGAEVEYIEYAGEGHGSWGKAFAEPDFLSWMFSKQKGR